jgi:hypothetical protein
VEGVGMLDGSGSSASRWWSKIWERKREGFSKSFVKIMDSRLHCYAKQRWIREWMMTKQVKQCMEYMVVGILVKLDAIRVNKKEVREIVMTKTISIKDEDGGIIHQFIWSM